MQQIREHPWFVNNLAKVENTDLSDKGADLSIFLTSADTETKSSKELKINPNIILEMAEKYKIPVNPTRHRKDEKKQENKPTSGEKDSLDAGKTKRNNEAETIKIEETLRDLANNKHNDLTTTYYLLHKAWV